MSQAENGRSVRKQLAYAGCGVIAACCIVRDLCSALVSYQVGPQEKSSSPSRPLSFPTPVCLRHGRLRPGQGALAASPHCFAMHYLSSLRRIRSRHASCREARAAAANRRRTLDPKGIRARTSGQHPAE